MAQVCRLGPRVGGRLALFCIHRVNRLYGALVVTHGHVTAPYKLSYHYYYYYYLHYSALHGKNDTLFIIAITLSTANQLFVIFGTYAVQDIYCWIYDVTFNCQVAVQVVRHSR